ncbi:MAG: outer membrane beta-barrel protein [Gammaproteobacteria bacterium]
MKNNIARASLAVCAIAALAASPLANAAAGGVDTGRLFVGAGLSQNDVSGSDDGTGYQFFGGYEFGQVAQNVALDLEVGYMDTGDMDVRVGPFTVDARAKGLWATGVGRLQFNPQFELLGRAGLDFGDDDGLMVGIGAGFNVNKQTQLRLEFVERDEVSSLQFNFVYRP